MLIDWLRKGLGIAIAILVLFVVMSRFQRQSGPAARKWTFFLLVASGLIWFYMLADHDAVYPISKLHEWLDAIDPIQ